MRDTRIEEKEAERVVPLLVPIYLTKRQTIALRKKQKKSVTAGHAYLLKRLLLREIQLLRWFAARSTQRLPSSEKVYERVTALLLNTLAIYRVSSFDWEDLKRLLLGQEPFIRNPEKASKELGFWLRYTSFKQAYGQAVAAAHVALLELDTSDAGDKLLFGGTSGPLRDLFTGVRDMAHHISYQNDTLRAAFDEVWKKSLKGR